MPFYFPVWALVTSLVFDGGTLPSDPVKSNVPGNEKTQSSQPTDMVCNCTITQAGVSYPISALMGTLPAASFYSYGVPIASSANTGLELSNGLILFLYEDINTGLISFFLIADIGNSGSGGSMEFELSCLPDDSYVVVSDEPGEFSGNPPVITGNWSWMDCCTDGGVVENVGCSNTFTVDLLLSTGIDSIVWLTGDIANPDQILMGIDGEAITINCGGGVCCPLGFDTEIIKQDASCEDTPNGSIDLTPQDGVPPFTYDWSNGESTEDISGLLPGIYSVTVTDSQGCTEEHDVEIDFGPGDPTGSPAMIELCSALSEDVFDLTSVEDIVNMNLGFEVIWFTDANLSDEITNPTNYLSPSSTVYAVVDNGACLSDPVPVDLILILTPIAMETSTNMCEEDDGMATFNLLELDNIISGGVGEVLWFLDIFLTDPVPDPEFFYTDPIIIYAVVFDGTCNSEPVEVELLIDPEPLGDPASAIGCGDANNEAVFDLIALEPEIGAGINSIYWYLEIELLDEILNPGFFQSTTTTVYAAIYDGICFSDPIPVYLTVEQTPIGNPITIQTCDDGSGMAFFNLWDYANQVNGGSGGVDWYIDEFLSDPIPDPGAFLTGSTVIFATVDNGACVSEPVQITLLVLDNIMGNPASLEVCADSSGQGVFNLTSIESVVSGGMDSIVWFEDDQGNVMITGPSAYVSSGSTVYAQVIADSCVSALIPVTLMIIQSVTATPTQYELCDEGSGLALFDLTALEAVVSGGLGQVNWYLDPIGNITIANPDSFPSSDLIVYAQVSAGSCVSGIVPVALSIHPVPDAMNLSLDLCGDDIGQLDLDLNEYDTLIAGGTGIVTWYSDDSLSNIITAPSIFHTGDTTLYATVSDGTCISIPAQLTISISQSLAANPVLLEICVPHGDSTITDLTQSDDMISGGVHQVHWLADSAGMLEITFPGSYPVFSSETLYAYVTDGLCVSEIVPVNITVMDIPTANPISILKCGDTNGQVIFNLTDSDALVSDNTGVVSWYADQALTQLIANPSSLLTGDTVVYAFVTNGFCIALPIPVILGVTDSLQAAPISIETCLVEEDTAFLNLTLSETDISSGNGDVIWFYDSLGLDTINDPSQFATTGGMVYAMVTADGCVSNIAEISLAVETSYYAWPQCVFSSSDSVAIEWLPVTEDFRITYFINGIQTGNVFLNSTTTFGLGGLNPGDVVSFWVVTYYDSICTENLVSTTSCKTDSCALVDITFPGLEPAYCREIPYVIIQAEPAGGQLTGEGISGDTLFINQVNEETTSLTYMLDDPDTGCSYSESTSVSFHDPPVSEFILAGIPCIDNNLQIDFTGVASGNAEFIWDFSGGDTISSGGLNDFLIHWDHPGNFMIGLQVINQSCISEPFILPVQIDPALEEPQLICVEETENSVTVDWEPVAGASGYQVSNNIGSGVLSGNTFTVSDLPADTEVTITIEAVTSSACGPTTSSIECRTLAKPLHTFLPNIFSPNDDGINDYFYVQSNTEVLEVKAMRIFDRWGDLVFEKFDFLPNDPKQGWDGTYDGKSMNPAVYVYWVELKTTRESKLILYGDVTLMR